MRRILSMTAILFLISTGAAFAGRGGGGHRGGGGGGRAVVRDHRGGGGVVRGGGGVVVRDHRSGPRAKRYPVRVTNGRYVFGGGIVRVYKRPVIRAHYYDMHVRPAIIVEAYDPVPGYIWVGGSWNWNGGEWVWAPGYWSVDASFVID